LPDLLEIKNVPLPKDAALSSSRIVSVIVARPFAAGEVYVSP